MEHNKVVSRDEWLAARRALLIQEKEATRLRDKVNTARLALPWVRVEAEYEFDTPEGRTTLAGLFGQRSQLIVYHFMLGPDWKAGCTGCSFVADHFDGVLPHLQHHDVSLVAVSRAALPQIDAYKARMGWHFPWVSSTGSSFNFDFGASFTEAQLASGTIPFNFTDLPAARGGSEMPGLSAFSKDEAGTVFHTYSSYTRGIEELIGTLMILDRAPKGRNESTVMDWVRRHDEYEDAPAAPSCCGGATPA